jgi:phage terminase large subunit-like protein
MPDAASLHRLDRAATLRLYRRVVGARDLDILRWFCLNDRYFLLTCILGLHYLNNEWGYARCREVEAAPDGYLDLWSRGHFKSTIITLGGIVQEVLRDPEITVCVLSYNSPAAQKLVGQIKQAFENPTLYELFPGILHEKPPRENWSLQKGLFVKREMLAKEPTVMGSGLVDGMPTGMHFKLRVYDDVVTEDSVGTPDQIAKTTHAYRLSDALGTGDGQRVWVIGTRYHPHDTYGEIIKDGIVTERRRICVDAEGRPFLLSPEALAEKRRTLGPRNFAAQMMQEPTGEGVRLFDDRWLMYYDRAPERRQLNVHILIDSANSKRKKSDFTTMWVVGLAADQNYYILDGLRDRMNLAERTRALFDLHRKWRPLCTWWEQVGAMSDAEHVREMQEIENYRFRIVDIPQSVPKADRIGWLVPLFAAARIWLPRRLLFATAGGETRDLIQDFITQEYSVYPVVSHDDMLDDLANIQHPNVKAEMRFPSVREEAREPARSNSEWNPYA